METILPGDLIRAARALLGWSQERLAVEAGITAKSLRDIESGTRRPTRKTNGQIRAVFERENVQFIAANHDGNEIIGTGVRWRPMQSNMTIKII
ncbi:MULTISPECIES: helix-turn-helix domain-containing protein [Rhizobium]|uniref:helix-turn-helix domain-containing protein n=1 Tax=Rhizobium TaxID=379 RepID=UPI00234ECE64|nr:MULTISPECIES: helix-turn-helix transcriptional regulator [unclassified Rhizobium]MDC7745966.1 helix-turn-helix transcriptional regulator [Rhizobium sp. BC56]MDC9812586.1 helix-turn-helix transcriptional regulator [Rhizobium sp. MC62]WEA27277.1 helix-turn-helix transcriptional regulator [Rhizobium sp. MJ22]WEA61751.1 helix-turn-helix transcriptional regulator [Rhizobium sp. BJ04]